MSAKSLKTLILNFLQYSASIHYDRPSSSPNLEDSVKES